MIDTYEDVTDAIEWVVEPPDDIYFAIAATLDADAGLNQECD